MVKENPTIHKVESRGWHKNQIRRSFQINQCLSPNSKFIGELNFVIHRWSKYLRQWKCYIFFALNRGWPEMFSNNRAIPKYWSFLQNKIAFGAWLRPIGAEMENKPSNCWLWLKANENAQEPICTNYPQSCLLLESQKTRFQPKMRHKMISGVNIWRVSTYLRNHLKYRAFSAKWN